MTPPLFGLWPLTEVFMDFPDLAAALTIIATIVGTTVRVMAKLNAIDRELLEARRDLADYGTRIRRIEEKLDL